MTSDIKYFPTLLSLKQKTLTKPPLVPLIPKPYTPAHNKHNTRRLPGHNAGSGTSQHARVDRVTIKGIDFVLGGWEAGEKIDVGVATEEGVSVPEDSAGRSVEGFEDRALGVEVLIVEFGEVFST